MNIGTIWYVVQDLFNMLSPVRRELRQYQFNNIVQLVDSDLLKQLLRIGINPSSAVEANEEQMDILEKFKKSVAITAFEPFALPSGYVRHIAAQWDDIPVDYVTMAEYIDRRSNYLTVPSASYPVFYITNDTIVTDPITIGTYTLWYYGENKGANKPYLGLKSENGITVYDSSTSVQLVWPEYMYSDIIMGILKYLGISINDPSMVQEKLKMMNNAA